MFVFVEEMGEFGVLGGGNGGGRVWLFVGVVYKVFSVDSFQEKIGILGL